MGVGEGCQLEPALHGRQLEDPLVGRLGEAAVQDDGGNGVEVGER